MYVRDVSHEQGNVYREYRTRVSGPATLVDDSSCSSHPDNVHQQLLDILNTASKLPPPSPVSCKRLDYSFEHSYDNQSSDESTADESFKGKGYLSKIRDGTIQGKYDVIEWWLESVKIVI